MAGFKFNFSEFGKPRVKKLGNSPRREIIQKNVIGVIGITIDARYFVDIDNTHYDLTIESYDIKGKNVYFAKILQNRRPLMIINLKKQTNNNKHYLPFSVGSIVKGSLYKILGFPRFNISKVLDYTDINPDEYDHYKYLSRQYKKFYVDNYEEIIKCMD